MSRLDVALYLSDAAIIDVLLNFEIMRVLGLL